MAYRLLFGKKLPMILQQERTECGHACLAMIANYFGHRFNLYNIRKLSQPSIRGTTLRELQELCSQLQLSTRALRVPISEFQFIQCPAILHWDSNHYVVLKKFKKNQVVIHDPAIGEQCYTLNEISHYFTGIVLEISPSLNFMQQHGERSLQLKDFFKLVSGLKPWVMLLLALSLVFDLLQLMNPLFAQYITDRVISSNDPHNLLIIALIFIVLMSSAVLIDFFRGNLIIYLSNHLTVAMSSHLMKHILKLPLSYFERRHQGDIQSKFQSIEQIQRKITVDLIKTVLDGLIIVVNLITMLFYSPILTSFVLASTVLYGITRYASYCSLKKQTDRSLSSHAKTATAFLETLQGIMPIKCFAKESTRFQQWKNHYIEALNADIRISKAELSYHISHQCISQAEYLLILCLSAHLVITQQFTTGMLMAFLSFRMTFMNKAASFIQSLFDYQLIKVHLHRLSDILLEPAETVAPIKTTSNPALGILSINNLSFSYRNTEPFLFHAINLSIKPGEKIAIIGPSGCGKSTLLKIMMGLLQPTSGNITIDQVSIHCYGLNNYRKLIAAVMQNDALFNGSIMDNIAFFDDELDEAKVIKAAELAQIHDTILSMPMTYETVIGDTSTNISGGQKQRILLARALYKEPRYLFLDEATSHLDIACEKKIGQALQSLDITQIIIAHRQETIAMADRVINLSELTS